MSSALHQQMEAALADLRVQQARIRSVSDQLKKATSTSTSKDRTIEATVDSQGKLTAVKLKGTGYRKRAPAEFAAQIVEAVRSAQDFAARQAADVLTGIMPAGLGLGLGSGPGRPFDGDRDIDAMFDAAASALLERRPEEEATDWRRGASDA